LQLFWLILPLKGFPWRPPFYFLRLKTKTTRRGRNTPRQGRNKKQYERPPLVGVNILLT